MPTPTPEELRQRLLELQEAHELAAARHETFRVRERLAEQTRLAIGQEQAAANRARREEASRIQDLESEIAEVRRVLASGTPGPNEVTDRAVVAWLECRAARIMSIHLAMEPGVSAPKPAGGRVSL